LTKPLYFYNGTTFEQIGPTTPQSPIAYQTSAPTGPATGDLWVDSDGDVDTYNRQLTRYYFVATAAQTTISGVDANSLTLAYVAGSEAVYVNGALQVRGQDYTATNGTSVVMSSALAVNDVVEIFAYTAFTVANAYTKAESDSLVGAAPGLKLLVPTSVAVGSGTASIGTAGQVTFSGASSVSLNDVFSTTYDNYKLVIKLVATLDSRLDFRMRVSGADNSTSNYYKQSNISKDVAVAGAESLAQDKFIGYGTNTSTTPILCDVFSPFIAEATAFLGWNHKVETLASTHENNFSSGIHNVASSFTGISLIAASGTISGTISVYGYKD
jgi:hypothetical protein